MWFSLIGSGRTPSAFACSNTARDFLRRIRRCHVDNVFSGWQGASKREVSPDDAWRMAQRHVGVAFACEHSALDVDKLPQTRLPPQVRVIAAGRADKEHVGHPRLLRSIDSFYGDIELVLVGRGTRQMVSHPVCFSVRTIMRSRPGSWATPWPRAPRAPDARCLAVQR